MRDYGQVQCSFWGHPDMVSMTDAGKVLSVYLLTGPHSNGLGCYRLPDAYLQADLGWTPEKVGAAFGEIESPQIDFCQRCPKSHFVFIKKYLRWNSIANGKVAIARMKEFDDIPSSFTLFSSLANDMVTHGKHWNDAFEIKLKSLIRSRSETVSDHDLEGLQDHDLKRYAKQEPNLTDPNQTLPVPEGNWIELDLDTGEVRQ